MTTKDFAAGGGALASVVPTTSPRRPHLYGELYEDRAALAVHLIDHGIGWFVAAQDLDELNLVHVGEHHLEDEIAQLRARLEARNIVLPATIGTTHTARLLS